MRTARNALASLLLVQSASAFAHGEGYLLAAAAGLAATFGALFGVVAAVRAPRLHPSYALTLALFLFVGGAVAWAVAGSSEGLALFLVFGGIGGAAPLAVGYFSCRAVFGLLRQAVADRVARSRAKAYPSLKRSTGGRPPGPRYSAGLHFL